MFDQVEGPQPGTVEHAVVDQWPSSLCSGGPSPLNAKALTDTMKIKIATIAAAVLVGTCGSAAAIGTRMRVVESNRMCSAPDSRVVVDVKTHSLALCEKENVVGIFDVRLGRGGTGKTREGDGKTPIGTYPLGDPRPSKRFGTFIPIGFPTEEQKKLGYSGSAVGVHGPPRWAKWLGSLVNTFDLSDGCVGVARDSEIEKIAAWVNHGEVDSAADCS